MAVPSTATLPTVSARASATMATAQSAPRIAILRAGDARPEKGSADIGGGRAGTSRRVLARASIIEALVGTAVRDSRRETFGGAARHIIWLKRLASARGPGKNDEQGIHPRNRRRRRRGRRRRSLLATADRRSQLHDARWIRATFHRARAPG